MLKRFATIIGVTALLLGGVGSFGNAQASPERSADKRDTSRHVADVRPKGLYFQLNSPSSKALRSSNPLTPSHLTYERSRQGVYSVATKISGSQAKSIALKRYPGAEYLDAKLVGGHTYHIRIVFQGKRIEVRVDANTGRIKGTS